MFSNLLESGAVHERGGGGHVFSFVLHTAAIGVAIVATHRVVNASGPAEHHNLVFVAPPEIVKPPQQTLPPTSAQIVIPKGYQILISPIDIPDVLPPIDFTRPITNEDNYTARGKPGGTIDGDPNAPVRAINASSTYLGSQVEKQAAQIPGTGHPDFPEALRQAGIDGTVDAKFVVDSTGRADLSTLTVLRTTHPLFADAVKKALPQMRFFSAEVAGQKVRQWVVMPFVFSIK